MKVINDDSNRPPPASWTLETVQAVEDKALHAFSALADERFRTSCKRLWGWEVMVVPAKNMAATPPPHELIGGDTDCHMARIWVGNSPPAEGRLAHEMAHAIQGCNPPDHTGWEPIDTALKAEGLPP